MRLLLVSLLGLLAVGADAGERLLVPAERAAGAPGTPTPQPFVRPEPRNPPKAPRLLDDGRGQEGLWLKSPRGSLAPADGELPLLEQQRRRNAREGVD
ncbi:hypothetical protein [Pseudomonas zhanjiangensis]|uniref:Uncharacterized protein n=1 Tax=Pseudomonas zhanjiangensis TaxID=3239015 RepID=A0ABV3YX92_9PSED